MVYARQIDTCNIHTVPPVIVSTRITARLTLIGGQRFAFPTLLYLRVQTTLHEQSPLLTAWYLEVGPPCLSCRVGEE